MQSVFDQAVSIIILSKSRISVGYGLWQWCCIQTVSVHRGQWSWLLSRHSGSRLWLRDRPVITAVTLMHDILLRVCMRGRALCEWRVWLSAASRLQKVS